MTSLAARDQLPGRRPGVMSAHQAELEAGWLRLFEERGFVAQSFLTFTWRQGEGPGQWHGVTPHKGMGLFQWWLQEVNRDLGGRNYKRACKHSLLSYAVGVDHHASGELHLHAVIDGWFDYGLAHKIWQARCGFLWIDEVKDPTGSLRHVLKYIRKADDFGPCVWFHRSPNRYPPADRLPEGLIGRVVPVKGGSGAALRTSPSGPTLTGSRPS